MFCKKGVLKSCPIFTRKHLCWSLFDTLGVNFITKRLQHRYFPANITKFLRSPIFKNICKQLHLNMELQYAQQHTNNNTVEWSSEQNLKVIKITLPENSEILKSSKNNGNSSKAVPIVGEDLQRAFYRLFYLQFCDSSDQWKSTV